MFIMLITAYIIFATNWVAGSNLSKQITNHFFNGEKVSPLISEVVYYTITIARIIANLLVAYILIKLYPKKAATFALVCLCFTFFEIFTSNYWLYTISRMIMVFINNGKEVDKEEKIIIFNALFKKTDTGLIKTENANDVEALLSILSKMNKT